MLHIHCAGTQDATYATWSHLDHTCAYVINMVLQKKKNTLNMGLNIINQSFLSKNTKAKLFLLHFLCLKVADIFVCRCYSSGERLCRRQAVQFGFSQDDIDQCELDNWGYWKAFVQWKYLSRTKLRYFLQVLLSLANWQRATHRIGNAPVQTPLPGSQFF